MLHVYHSGCMVRLVFGALYTMGEYGPFLGLLIGWMCTIAFLEYLYYVFMNVPSRFYRVLVAHEQSGFYMLMGQTCLYIVVIAAAKGVERGLTGFLYTRTRRLLYIVMRREYLLGPRPNLVRLAQPDTHIDNPDQRLCADLDHYCKTLYEIIPVLFVWPSTVAWYSYETIQIVGWRSPAWIYLHFAAGAVAFYCVSQRLARQVGRKEVAEGSFRAAHAALATHAENVAMSQGRPYYGRLLDELLHTLVAELNAIVTVEAVAQTVNGLLDYSASVLAYMIIGLALFHGAALPQDGLAALISRNTSISMTLLYKLCRLFAIATVVGNHLGYAERLHAMYAAMLAPAPKALAEPCRAGQVLELHGCQVQTPQGRVLVANLTMALGAGESLLITGPSGAGKSSLFRVITGIWACDGRRAFAYDRQPAEALYVAASHDALLYPHNVAAWQRRFPDDVLATCVAEVLAFLQLPQLAADWTQLSHGEQQRVGIARLLLWRPRIALLDEACNSLPEPLQLQILQRLMADRIQVLCISHLRGLAGAFRRHLHLHGDGTYALR